MGAWSSLVKAVKSLFKGSSTAAASTAAKTSVSWASAAKVAVAGGFTYLFCTGGLSSVVSTTLGIPEWLAQVIIVACFVVVLALVARYLINWLKDRKGLKTEYLEEPALDLRRGSRDSGRQRPEAPGPAPGAYDPRSYDGSRYSRYSVPPDEVDAAHGLYVTYGPDGRPMYSAADPRLFHSMEEAADGCDLEYYPEHSNRRRRVPRRCVDDMDEAPLNEDWGRIR